MPLQPKVLTSSFTLPIFCNSASHVSLHTPLHLLLIPPSILSIWYSRLGLQRLYGKQLLRWRFAKKRRITWKNALYKICGQVRGAWLDRSHNHYIGPSTRWTGQGVFQKIPLNVSWDPILFSCITSIWWSRRVLPTSIPSISNHPWGNWTSVHIFLPSQKHLAQLVFMRTPLYLAFWTPAS